MNALLEARRKLAEALKNEEELLTKLVAEDRDATAEEGVKLGEYSAAKKRNAAAVERLEAIKNDSRSAVDDGAEVRAAPRIEVTRSEGEDENGQYKPFKSIGEQLQAIHRAAASPNRAPDSRLYEINKRAASGLNEGVGADGGFLVQVDFGAAMLDQAIATGTLASRCTKFPVGAGRNGVEYPRVDESSRATGSRWGGVQVYWAKEGDSATVKRPKFRIDSMKFHKLIGLCVATDEMLEDASFLGAFISKAFNEEMGAMIDKGIVRGTGDGEMLGILNSGSLITAAAESGQTADTITGKNALDMRKRLLPNSLSKAVWLHSFSASDQVQSLTITKGKSDIPLFKIGDGANSLVDSVLAREALASEQCSAVGDVGDIILADFSSYAIITRNVQEASSIHAYFSTAEQAFRFTLRINGQPLFNKPLTPEFDTANTLSSFVTLAAR